MHIHYFDTGVFQNISPDNVCLSYIDAVRRLCASNASVVAVDNEYSFKINSIPAFETDSSGNCFYEFEIDRRYDIISDLKVFSEESTSKLTEISGDLLKIISNRVCISKQNEKVPSILTMCTMYTNLKLRICLGPVPSNFKVSFCGYLLNQTTRQLWINREVSCDGLRYSDGLIL
jgi:hypothetical protein